MIDFNNDAKLLLVFNHMINAAKIDTTTHDPVVRAIWRIRQDALSQLLSELLRLVGKYVTPTDLREQAYAAAKEELDTKATH